MMSPKVSIVVVNYKGINFLKDFFISLKEIDYQNFEIILVDNASGDGSIEYVRKNYPTVKVINNNKNLGFVIANNKATKIARGKYLFFLNNDTKVDPQVISELINEMEKDPEIGICGCKMMSYDEKRYFHVGIGLDIFGYPIVKDKIFYIEGSALMIRKELFNNVDGFDSAYFMFHEDIDLAWRVQLLGYKVVALPKAIVYHVAGGSAGGGEMQKGRYKSNYLRRYYHERNNIRTLLKNYQVQTLIFILPCYFLINLLEVFFFLITLKFKVAYLYLKAYAWNFVNLRDSLNKRAKIQESRVISDKQLIKKMYFGSGKLIAFLKVGIPVFR